MNPKRIGNGERGQGLAEYALILVLVAIVVIVAAASVGLAVQRLYGVVAGALGAKHDTVGHLVIESAAQCWIMPPAPPTYPTGFVGINLTGTTDIPFADLTYSTEGSVGTTADGSPVLVQGNPVLPNFIVNAILAPSPDASKCPQSVVIQAKTGAIAISPVTVCRSVDDPGCG